jgi:glycosyltransferase involved in cell wall biosynthesis
MRIAFDGRPLLGPRTGVGVWLEGLLDALVRDGSHESLLALPRRRGELGLDPTLGAMKVVAPAVPMLGTVWLQTVAGPQVSPLVDVYVATLGILPRRLAVPSVVVLHDLTPRTRPHQHTVANRFCFNAYLEDSLLAASVVVCDSQATRARLACAFQAVAAEAVVIPPGVSRFFSPGPPGGGEATRDRFAAGRPYVVQLGTLEPRKGVATLIAAHGQLVAADRAAPSLVLAGGRGWGGDLLERALGRHPAPERIHLPGYVTREDARDLLRHAEVVVVAAEEEGYGLPLAEALACGAACISSDEPALVEVGAGAARTFPRRDASALAAVLAELLAGDRAPWHERARARGAALGWEDPLASWQRLLEALRIPHDAASRH